MALEFKPIRVSQKFRRWLVTGVLILGIVPFVGVSILPFFSGGETAQPPAQETAAPTPTPTIAQVSPAARQEELKGRVRGYEAILQHEPQNQTALAELYVTRKELVQLGAGDVKDTVEPLEKLAQLNPNDLSLQLELGSVYAQQLRYEDAIAVYDTASKLNPQDFRPFLAKGIVLQLQGKKEEAKSVFATATNIAPEGFKEQVKAQIQQIETVTSTPPKSPPNAPAKDSKTQPTTAAPASTSAPTSTTPTTPASDNKAQPSAPNLESKPVPTNSSPNSAAGETKTQPTIPTPAPTNSSSNAPASDTAQPVAPTPASSPSN